MLSKRVGEKRVPSSCAEHPSGVILAPKPTTSSARPEIQDPAPWAPPPAPKGKRAKDTPVFHRKKSSDDGSLAQEGGTWTACSGGWGVSSFPLDFMSAQTTASVQPLRPPPGLPNFGLAGGSHPFPRPLGPPANDHLFLLSPGQGQLQWTWPAWLSRLGRNRHPAHRHSPSPQLLLSPCLCVHLCPSFSASPCHVSPGQEGSLL